jgi:hypothetical protein
MHKFCATDEYAMLHLSSNDENEDLLLTLSRSLVISDNRNMGTPYIQAHIDEKFLVPRFHCVARAITHNKFQIDPLTLHGGLQSLN